MTMHKYLERLKNLDYFNPKEIREICTKFIALQSLEPNVVHTTSPVTCVGDIHGQFYDLLNIFKLFKECSEKKYIFLGDYVDRGKQSLHTYLILCVYKILYPHNIFLIRGNHEIRNLRSDFRVEIFNIYKSNFVYDIVSETFSSLLVGVIIDARILCVHGGISPGCVSISKMQKIDRFSKKIDPVFNDIMWSDPYKENYFRLSTRGAGWSYGADAVRRFLMMNNLRYIVRAHQLAKKGYTFHFEDRNLITVWSAPNYCYTGNNLASVLEYTGGMIIKDEMFKIFRDVHDTHNQRPNTESTKEQLKND